MSVQDTIRQQVTSNPVVLYMKGSPQMPMCGFSATATQLLKMCGAQDIFTVDVETVDGVAKFADLRIDQPGQSYTLVARS